MEILQAVILTPEEWTPENGMVTAAQKIQRNKIAKEFEKEIKVCFPPPPLLFRTLVWLILVLANLQGAVECCDGWVFSIYGIWTTPFTL